jgi:hypothetical protein
MDSMTIQPATLILAGALLLALVTVETGGMFLVKVARGGVLANALQKSLFRAGHAHAAVLLVLSLTILALIDQAPLPPLLAWIGRSFVPFAAILMPAGFFLSVIGRDPQKPNRLMALLWIGAAVLTIGLVVSGIGLIVGGASRLG